MNNRHSFRILLVALLCLWLPLQAAAGLLLPCHSLDQATRIAVGTADQPVTHQGCGDAGPEAADGTSDKTVNENTSCYHCQVSCHFGTAILIPTALPSLMFAPIHYSHAPTPALNSVLLDGPQRPPRHT